MFIFALFLCFKVTSELRSVCNTVKFQKHYFHILQNTLIYSKIFAHFPTYRSLESLVYITCIVYEKVKT